MKDQVDRVARALEVEVIEQLAGGEFGAFLVETMTGTRLVLKVLPAWEEFKISAVMDALDLLPDLREQGYPIPRYLGAGMVEEAVYSLQEFVAGEIPVRLDENIACQLIELWRTHENAAPRTNRQWGKDLLAAIMRGEDLLEKTSDPRVQKLIHRALDIARGSDCSIFRTTDIVHGDFHSANLLVLDEKITAVFDWEGALVGDSRADLVRLLAGSLASNAISPTAEAIVRKELAATTPRQVWLPIGAELVMYHLRWALFAKPDQLGWVLAEAEILLPE